MSNFYPLPGSQWAFLSSPVFETLYEGTRGNGKTQALLMDFAQHTAPQAGFGPYWRGVLFRETYKQLDDVVAKSLRLFREVFPRARFNAGSYTWKWPTGAELLLRHFKSPQDYWNYHGHEYPWIGWEELTNWAASDCYESMFACSRSPQLGMPRKYRATCNPYGRGHNWVKARFIDPAPRGTIITANRMQRMAIHGDVSENTVLLRADPEYLAKLDAISDPNKRAAWRHGSWDITSGGMFDDLWRREVHVLAPFEIPRGWKIDRAFDWGSSKPFSVGWWAESDGTDAKMADGTTRSFPRGTLIRIGEWYGWTGKENEGLRLLAAEVADGILKREAAMGITDRVIPGPADTSIFDIENGNTISGDMAGAGVYWTYADKSPGSRKQGWEAIRGRLQNSTKREGPGLYTFHTCLQFLRTFVPLPRDEADPDDVDSSVEDHIGDEVRYRVYTGSRSATNQPLEL